MREANSQPSHSIRFIFLRFSFDLFVLRSQDDLTITSKSLVTFSLARYHYPSSYPSWLPRRFQDFILILCFDSLRMLVAG